MRHLVWTSALFAALCAIAPSRAFAMKDIYSLAARPDWVVIGQATHNGQSRIWACYDGPRANDDLWVPLSPRGSGLVDDYTIHSSIPSGDDHVDRFSVIFATVVLGGDCTADRESDFFEVGHWHPVTYNGHVIDIRAGGGDDELQTARVPGARIWGDGGNDTLYVDQSEGLADGGEGCDRFSGGGLISNETYLGGPGADCISDGNHQYFYYSCGGDPGDSYERDDSPPSWSGCRVRVRSCEGFGAGQSCPP